ncbi:MAG: hypothetical protein ACI8UX_000802, partial [Psychromonas sp.]
NIDNSPLSIHSIASEKEHFNLYPNPAIDKTVVRVLDVNAHISVTDLMEKNVPISTSFKTNIGWQIDLNKLQNGSYLMHLKSKEKAITKDSLNTKSLY